MYCFVVLFFVECCECVVCLVICLCLLLLYSVCVCFLSYVLCVRVLCCRRVLCVVFFNVMFPMCVCLAIGILIGP